MTWLWDVLRSICFFLDKLVYGLISIVYNLFVDIAQTTIFTNEIIELFASRIYALLGVFMLFKVSFSILSYIVNPDEFVDKNKGFSKIISNIVITLVLLVATPWIFNRAMDIQRIILRENVIGKIFSTTEINSNVIADAGNVMAYETFKGFYHINTDEYPSCMHLESGSVQNDVKCELEAFNNSANYEDFKKDLEYAYQTNSIDIYTSIDLVNHKSSNGSYTMSYLYGISTLCGGAIVLILITFCFDIAVRSIKLGFLRVIAPIPIASRIIPKKGEDVFNKWLKLCINTYLDLFIRLIAIYFALFVITQVVSDIKSGNGIVDSVTGAPADVNVFVKIFIILGALLFAKQLPKLIEDITGIKMDGKFTMNPLKKMSEVPVAGKLAAAGVGGVDSLIHGNGFAAGVKRNWDNVAWGGDGKKSILDTADRKMRKDIRKKRDLAQQRYEGMKEFDDMHSQWEQGDKIREKFDKLHASDPTVFRHAGNDFDKNFENGQNAAAYNAVYKNDEFKSSLMKLDAADYNAKEFAKAYAMASAQGAAFRGTTITKADGTIVTFGANDLDALYAENEKQQKIKAGAEAVHNTMRKTYAADAKIQDAIKMRKNNAVDPTNI